MWNSQLRCIPRARPESDIPWGSCLNHTFGYIIVPGGRGRQRLERLMLPYFHMDNRLILVWNRLNLRDSLLRTTTFRIEWSTQSWDQKLPVGHWRIHSFPFLNLVWQLNRRRVVLNIPRRDSWCYPKTLSWGCKKLYPEQQKVNKTIEICCT